MAVVQLRSASETEVLVLALFPELRSSLTGWAVFPSVLPLASFGSAAAAFDAAAPDDVAPPLGADVEPQSNLKATHQFSSSLIIEMHTHSSGGASLCTSAQ